MTPPTRSGWVLPLLAVAAVTGGAAIFGAILVSSPDEPAPRPSVSRTLVEPDVPPVSDVHWDAAAAKAAEALPAVPVNPGDEFHVTSEVDDRAVAAAVLAASRKALPLTLALLGGEPGPQRRPYEVHVVRTRERVNEEARRMGWTPPATVVGFADLVRSRIYVTSDDLGDPDDVLALAGPGIDLTATASHEAAHQVASRCIPGAGSGADWLCEGIAQYVSELVVLETYPGTEIGAVPYFSEHMRICQDLLEADRLPRSTDILLGRLDGLDGGDKYAIYWAFFRYLHQAAQRDRTQKLIAQIRRLPWSPDGAARIFDVADSVWNTTEREGLTAGFQKHVAAFAPQWRYVAGRFEVSGTTWTQVATLGSQGHAVRASRAGRADYVIRGGFEILPRGDKIAEVRFGETPAGWVQVAFEADQGVRLWADAPPHPDGFRGPPLVHEEIFKPVVGRRTEFTIRVTSKEVHVYLDGARVIDWDPRGRDMSGAWGVDCGNYWKSKTPTVSAAIWHDVRLE